MSNDEEVSNEPSGAFCQRGYTILPPSRRTDNGLRFPGRRTFFSGRCARSGQAGLWVGNAATRKPADRLQVWHEGISLPLYAERRTHGYRKDTDNVELTGPSGSPFFGVDCPPIQVPCSRHRQSFLLNSR